jgi:hypothetical protein
MASNTVRTVLQRKGGRCSLKVFTPTYLLCIAVSGLKNLAVQGIDAMSCLIS